MSEPKKHHYIPEFYLKQWSAPDTGKLVRYYRPYNDVVADFVSPSSTAHEHELYSLQGYAPEAKNVIEKKYMGPVVDEQAAKALRVLSEQDSGDLSPETRQGWTRFLMSLRLRTPEKINDLVQQADKQLRERLSLAPEEYNAVRKSGDPTTFVQWVEKNAPAIFPNFGKQLLPKLIDNEKIGTAIIQMQWTKIGITQEFPDLLTCDNPVYMSHGLDDKRCVIALPLSPRFAFLATHSADILNAVMSEGGTVFTKRLNAIMADQTQKYVYGNGKHKRHQHFIEKRLRRE